MGDSAEENDSDYESELSDQEIVDNSESEVESNIRKSLCDRFKRVIEQYRELVELVIGSSSKEDGEVDMSDSIVALFDS